MLRIKPLKQIKLLKQNKPIKPFKAIKQPNPYYRTASYFL